MSSTIQLRVEDELKKQSDKLFKELGTTLPDEPIIKRFKELGGKYITLGTDSHNTEFVGKGIEKGIEILKRCGFSQYTIYENHKPVMIDIE